MAKKRLNFSSGTEWEPKVGYSRAVRVDDEVYVSGTTATDEDGDIVEGGPYEQAKQAFENVQKALEDADASLSDVVRTRMYVTDIDEWQEIGRAHSEFFDDIRPAATMVEVDRLVSEEMVVEIEAKAVVTDE